MSRATDVAEREAAEAEAEPETEPGEDEAEAEAEQEREQEAEPEAEPAPSSLAVIGSQEKALEAESKRHEKALSKALGDHWPEFAMCPLCQVDGYAVPYGPGEVSPEQRDAVMTVLGESGPSTKLVHQTKIRCAACDGWGKLYTGSRDESYAYDVCLVCNGSGTVEKQIVQPVQNGQAQQAWTPPPTPEYAPPVPNTDRWGRVFGQEHYGEDPAFNGGLW